MPLWIQSRVLLFNWLSFNSRLTVSKVFHLHCFLLINNKITTTISVVVMSKNLSISLALLIVGRDCTLRDLFFFNSFIILGSFGDWIEKSAWHALNEKCCFTIAALIANTFLRKTVFRVSVTSKSSNLWLLADWRVASLNPVKKQHLICILSFFCRMSQVFIQCRHRFVSLQFH